MKPEPLLSRDQFRTAVFARDRMKCVSCSATAADAHHIIERRIWPDGGYYLSNGASLCGACHILAEQTVLSCEEIRAAAGIHEILLPPHLYDDPALRYDKWTNLIHPDGTRTPGELFHDESVQKILAASGVLGLFRPYVKYPRTLHLPWSPGRTEDDRVLTEDESDNIFTGQEIVITEKIDGENTSVYADYLHARSIDGESHPSQSWVRNLQSQIGWQLPDKWRLCGENVYAEHTLAYTDLPSYFLLFSVWNDRNCCLSWDDTVEWAGMLDLVTVPVLWRGVPGDAQSIQTLMSGRLDLSRQEGYVVRLAGAFPYAAFRRSIAKYVRAEHVGTSHHWKSRQVIPNRLAAPCPSTLC